MGDKNEMVEEMVANVDMDGGAWTAREGTNYDSRTGEWHQGHRKSAP